jgi:MFS family permease
MPRAVSKTEHGKMLKHRFIPLYVASLLLMFHGYVVAYVNSSLLEKYFSTVGTSTVYIIASALTILIFLFMSRVLHKLGNYKLTLTLVFIDLFSVLGISFADSMRAIAPLVITHLIVLSLIIFNIDIFMEEHIGNNEGVTGTRRGLLLALVSTVSAIAPFISSELVSAAGGSFQYAYMASAVTLIPIIFILLIYLRDFRDPAYTDIHALEAIRGFWQKKDVRAVFIVHFVLQIFFMTMVVFSPIYLIKNIGLSWAEFGMVMFVCQLAYVIMEYPIGIIADKLIGEKEMMALGLMIMAISTAWIAFVDVQSVFMWALVMFVTRVGAAFVEVTTEVHFFKRTNSSDAQIISFFRVTRPLSYVVGAIIASLSLLYLPFNLLFVVIASLMIPAMFMTLDIEDTK